ncbi:hypothetical protein DXV76_03035 [Rhodobacteraceae bacterium CCMM004]|nr:hypothetical protein DXV76_03035 [Rhodobacteraceae bacterium CCMM004]
MVGSNKILTVSYGTFSCTLEGFDQPFSTMQQIAEYFRDLAADDRYFGAEPPQPDAEMLHRIAEREIQRRVEARVEKGGVVLRPAPVTGADRLPAPAPAAAAPERPRDPTPRRTPAPAYAGDDGGDDLETPGFEVEIDGDSVAAKLSRIRAVVARARAARSADYEEDEPVEASVLSGDIETAFAAVDDAAAPDAGTADAGLAETSDESEPAWTALQAMEDDVETAPEEDRTPELDAAETAAAAAAGSDAADALPAVDPESIAAQLPDALSSDAPADQDAADMADLPDTEAADEAAAGADTADALPEVDPEGIAVHLPDALHSGAVADEDAADQHDTDSARAAANKAVTETDTAKPLPQVDPEGIAAHLPRDDDEPATETVAAALARAETAADIDAPGDRDDAAADATDTVGMDVSEDADADSAPDVEGADTSAEGPFEDGDEDDVSLQTAPNADDGAASETAPAVDTDGSEETGTDAALAAAVEAADAPTGAADAAERREPAPVAAMDDDEAPSSETEEEAATAEALKAAAAAAAAAADDPDVDMSALMKPGHGDETDDEDDHVPLRLTPEVRAEVQEADAAPEDTPDVAATLDNDEEEDVAEEVAEEPRPVVTPRRPHARIVKLKRSDFEAALAAGDIEEVDEDDDDDDLLADVDDPADDDTDAPVAAEADEDDDALTADIRTIIGDSSLDPEEEAELAAELAAVEREAMEAERRSAETAAAALDEDDDEPADTAPAANEGEQALDRLLSETNAKLGDSEGNRRRSAIAHLKAAVAATKADRLLRNVRQKNDAETLNRYRDDLAQVVRPRRPAAAELRGRDAAPRRPSDPTAERPAPLMLVSSLRVDTPDGRPQAIRPRRIVAPDARPAEAAPSVRSFGDFAAEMGATELPDLLEAAAAYAQMVEGKSEVSRTEIMRRVAALDPDNAPTREQGLKSFGHLLRSGRIRKLKRGVFTLSDDTPLAEKARAHGG